MRSGIMLAALAAWTAGAQTQIDLRTQAKSVDFSAAGSTKPLKMGPALPGACTLGEVFFNTSSSPGSNLYACTAPNSWSVEGGISGQSCWTEGGTGLLRCRDSQGNLYGVIKMGAQGTANQWVDYIDASGIPHTSQPSPAAVGSVADPGGNGIPFRSGFGVAAPATANEISGPFFCQDNGVNSNYQCSLSPAIGAYLVGATYWFRANSTNTGAATLNLNGLGAKPILKQSTQPLAAGDIKAGQWVIVTYDGANLQMQSQTGSPTVGSVFGRTGNVSAQAGDYSASQVTNAVDQTANYVNPAWIGSLNWAKITGAPTAFAPSPHGATHGGAGTDPVALDASQIVSGTLAASRLPNSAMLNNASNTVSGGTQDLSGADHTLPMKTGTLAARPTTCKTGETYFATDAAPGSNMYGCTMANTWSAEAASPVTVSIANGGTVVGSRDTINIVPGQGLASIVTDTGSQINVQLALDSAVLQTQTVAQSGSSLLCASAGGTNSNYTCAMNPTAAAYTIGMTVNWMPDVSGAGGATTLNIDTLGAVPITLADGVSSPASTDIAAGRMYTLWYDGLHFRMPPISGLLYTPENLANKGQANGYAALDNSGRVPAAQLPASIGLSDGSTIFHNYGVNTGSATMTLDMSAATTAGGFRIPVLASCSSSADGALCYDPTGKNTHLRANGADAIAGAVTGAPANNDCAKFVVSGNTVTLSSAGGGCTTGGGSVDANTFRNATFCPDTSAAANQIVCTTTTTFPNSYSIGQSVIVRLANNVTGPATININGLGNRNITKNGTAALANRDLLQNGVYLLTYDGSEFVTNLGTGMGDSGGNGVVYRNALNATAPATADNMTAPHLILDSGSVNSIAGCPAPAVAAYTPGTTFVVKAANGNTGPVVANICSLGPKSVVKSGSLALSGGEIASGQYVILTYDGTNLEMQNAAANGPGCTIQGGSAYYSPWPWHSDPIGQLATANLGTHGIRVMTFTPTCTVTFSSITWFVSTASGTSCTGGACGAVFGIYSLGGTLLSSSTVAISGGSPNINATGWILQPWNGSQTLYAGTPYILALTSDSTALNVGAIGSWSQASALNVGGRTYNGTAVNFSAGNGLALALPAVSGGITAQSSNQGEPMAVILR